MTEEDKPASVLANLLNTTKGYLVKPNEYSTKSGKRPSDVYEPLITQGSVNRLADQMEAYIDPAILKETKLSETLREAFQNARSVRSSTDQEAVLDTGHLTRSVITKDDLQFHAQDKLEKPLTNEQRENIKNALQERIEKLPDGNGYEAAANILKANIAAVNNADKNNNGIVTVGELLCSLAENKVIINEGEIKGHRVPEPYVAAIPVNEQSTAKTGAER